MDGIRDVSALRVAGLIRPTFALLLTAALCVAVVWTALADNSSSTTSAAVEQSTATDTTVTAPSSQSLLQLAQADDEPAEEDFIACAVICQRRLDKQLLNCSGYKNRGAEGSRAPMPAASCRDDAHAAYKSCRSACDERWPGNRDKYPS